MLKCKSGSLAMMSHIVVSSDKKLREQFLSSFITKNSILPSHTFRISPLKNEISIDQARQVKREVIVSVKSPRLFIFYDFSKASLEAQNALLKTLEESVQNYFILITSNLYKVIPTIRSRSQIIHLENASDTKVGEGASVFIENLIKTNNFSFLGEKMICQVDKEKALQFIDELTNYFYINLEKERRHGPAIIKTALVIKEGLEVNNLNPQLAIDRLLIFARNAYKMKL